MLEKTRERDLLVRLIQGDEAAFNEIYRCYSKPMYRRIAYLVKNPDITDELVQELFIKIWVNRTAIAIEKSFQSYLYTIAQNLVYNYFRKAASDQSLLRTLQLNIIDQFFTDEPTDNEQANLILTRAIEQLSPQRKQVFNLCKIEGKSYKEVSEIMDISIATVNSHMTKSLHIIKEFLLKHQDIAFLLIITFILHHQLLFIR